MDIGKSFTFVTEDEKWLSKMVVGAIIAAVPILNFAWMGYMIDVMRRVLRNDPMPLPDWGDLGEKFMQGLLISIASFIYSLPALIVLCLPMGFMIAASSASADAGEALAAIGGVTSVLLVCCLMIYGLAISFLFPAISLNYAEAGTFASCFEFGKIWARAQANLSAYLTAWLVILAAGFGVTIVIGLVGGLLGWIPCLGQILLMAVAGIASAYMGAVYGHLFGQVGSQNPPIDAHLL